MRHARVAVAILVLLTGSIAQAGFTTPVNPASVAAAAAAARQQAAAQAAASAAAKQAYYSTWYPNESGPFSDYDGALNTAIWEVNATARNSGDPEYPAVYGAEYGSTIYRDAYGLYYYTRPNEGSLIVMRQRWETQEGSYVIQRPGVTIMSTVHTHVLNSGHQQLSQDDPHGDNNTAYPEYVLIPESTPSGVWDGRTNVWFLKGNEHRGTFIRMFYDYGDNELYLWPAQGTLNIPSAPPWTPDGSYNPYAVQPVDNCHVVYMSLTDYIGVLLCDGNQLPRDPSQPATQPSGEPWGILITGEEPPADHI